MSILRHILGLCAIAIIGSGTMAFWLHGQVILLPGFHNTNSGNPQTWAHRGGGGRSGYAENSVAAVKNAVIHGMAGAELDVFYDAAMGDIIVSHDYPYVKPDGKILRLSEIPIPDHFYFWLDAKNLDQLSFGEIRAFAAILKKLELEDQVLVESPSLKSLIILDQSGITTMFWAYAEARRSPLYYLVIKAVTWLGGIDMVSVSIDNLEYLHPHFARASLASFTLNSTESLCAAKTAQSATILLSGLKPQQLSSLSCH